MRSGSPVYVAGGEAVVPSVIKAVSVARQRGILIVWVSLLSIYQISRLLEMQCHRTCISRNDEDENFGYFILLLLSTCFYFEIS